MQRTVDDRPFGGGPGMVLKAEPLAAAIRAVRQRLPAGAPVIGLSAQGRPSPRRRRGGWRDWPDSAWWPGATRASTSVLSDALIDEELSIGDYVLSGGELPALVVIDAVARLLPGVLGHEESAEQESFGDGLLDWPHYTRPESVEGRPVPQVLLGGNHAAIRRWRLMQALGRTWRSGRTCCAQRSLTRDERAMLEEYCAGAGDRAAAVSTRNRFRPIAGKLSMNKIMQELESRSMKRKLPEFGPGDTVVVQVKVREGDRERVQAYEGVVIACKNRGLNSSFTVRKVSHGEGVERVFQTHSPSIAEIEVKRRGKVRRAKLYYLRDRSGKSARIEEKLGG